MTFTVQPYVQFSGAENLINLITGLLPYITIPENEFYNDFFNLATCNAQGLDNWAQILNISRGIFTPDWTNIFGFDTGVALVDNQYPCNFEMGNFYNGEVIVTTLTDDELRNLLYLRYAYITTNTNLISSNIALNNYVLSIDSSYKAAVENDGIMTMIFKFNWFFTDTQYTILTAPGILPVPMGVAYTILQNVPL